MKPKAIVFDLDGTLCEIGDSTNPYNHDGEELPIESMHRIYHSFFYWGKDIFIILTGRKKKEHGKATMDWLTKYDIVYDRLIMQEGSTAEKNHIFKEKELKKLQERYEIIAVFDDNELLKPICKKLGIPLLHVNI